MMARWVDVMDDTMDDRSGLKLFEGELEFEFEFDFEFEFCFISFIRDDDDG